MTYVWAASRGCNAARAACRKAPRLGCVGERRNVASIQYLTCFISRCEPSIANHHRKDGEPTISSRGVNYMGINDGIFVSSSDDDNTMLPESLQIRFVGTLPIFVEDDGG